MPRSYGPVIAGDTESPPIHQEDTMTTTTPRTRSARRTISRRIVTGVTMAGAAAALAVAATVPASAEQVGSYALSPGQGQCTPSQYAGYQVRGDVWATGQGAKFKLLRNGVVVWNTPSRVTAGAVELRSAYGTFPGPGYYSLCAQNTGTTNTIATMQLRTDGEF